MPITTKKMDKNEIFRTLDDWNFQLIHVCWQLRRKETRNREIRALLKAMEEFKLKESLVITEDYEAEEKIKDKRINFLPLWKWLLL